MRGSRIAPVTLQIMLALVDGKRHGYGIKLDVEARTDGQMKIGSGTLYEAIQRLVKRRWITEVEPPDSSDALERRFYELTPAGDGALQTELERLDQILTFARGRRLLS